MSAKYEVQGLEIIKINELENGDIPLNSALLQKFVPSRWYSTYEDQDSVTKSNA